MICSIETCLLNNKIFGLFFCKKGIKYNIVASKIIIWVRLDLEVPISFPEMSDRLKNKQKSGRRGNWWWRWQRKPDRCWRIEVRDEFVITSKYSELLFSMIWVAFSDPVWCWRFLCCLVCAFRVNPQLPRRALGVSRLGTRSCLCVTAHSAVKVCVTCLLAVTLPSASLSH